MDQGGRGPARSQIWRASWTMVKTLDLLLGEMEPLQDFELKSDKICCRLYKDCSGILVNNGL